MATHSITRRSIMSAMAVAPIAITIPAQAMPTVSTAEWDAAEAAYRVVRAKWNREMDAFDAVAKRHFANPELVTGEDYSRAEDEVGRLCELDSEALNRLNNTPAPHMRAAILKLELASDYDLAMAPVIADMKRLAGV